MLEKNACQLWGICTSAALSGIVFGYNVVVFNLCQLNVAYTLDWGENTHLYISLFTSILLVGALFSSPVAGSLSNIIGRKNTLLLGNSVGFAGAFITVIPYTPFFGLGRFLTGVAVGFYTVITPVYISEMASVQLAGKLGSVFILLLKIGLFGGLAMGLVLPDEVGGPRNNWWFFMFLLPAIVILIQSFIIVARYNFDTPHWLALKGDYITARGVLNQLGRGNEVIREREATNKASYKDLLCSRKYSKPMRVGMSAIATLPLSGLNLFGFYSTYMFNSIGFDMFYARLYSTVLGISELIAIFVLFIVVNRLCRKVLLVGGIAVNVLTFVLMVVFLDVVKSPIMVVVFAVCFKVSFVLSTGSIPYILLSEILEPRGVGIGSSLLWFLHTVVGTTGLYALNNLTIAGTLLIYACVSFLLGLHLFFDMIETKDRSKEEVQNLYLKVHKEGEEMKQLRKIEMSMEYDETKQLNVDSSL